MTFWVAGATVVGSIAGGAMQSNAADKAARLSADATNRATALQEKMYKEGVQRQQPFYQAGVNALPELVQASKYTNFGMDQFQQDPGYGFRLKEGLNALDRTAAARGGMLGGNQLRGAVQYGQELGSQEYQNAFNRYQTERNARLNPLQSLAGYGQTGANNIGQMGQNYATNAGNAYMNQGVNAANASLVGANARASSYGDIASTLEKRFSNYDFVGGGQNGLDAFANQSYPGAG